MPIFYDSIHITENRYIILTSDSGSGCSEVVSAASLFRVKLQEIYYPKWLEWLFSLRVTPRYYKITFVSLHGAEFVIHLRYAAHNLAVINEIRASQ